MNTPESQSKTEPVAVVSSDWFGSGVWTAADLLENAYLSDIERWWEAWEDGKHHQFVREGKQLLTEAPNAQGDTRPPTT